MKILQISAVYGIGSVGKIVKDIHTTLLEKKIDSKVICGISNNHGKDPNVIVNISKIGRYLSHLYYFFTGINFSLCFFATKKIIKLIKTFRPDVIHIHCCNDYYINIHRFIKWLKKHNKTLVITQHCEQYYTGSCGYSLGCEKWKENGCDGHCHFFKHHQKGLPLIDRTQYMWRKMKKSFSNFDNNNLWIISCTPWLDERMKKSLIFQKVINHKVIYNGADNLIYKHYDYNTKHTKKTILYVTPRFEDEIKGSKYINNIARKFIDYPDIEIKIIGYVPKEFKLEKNIISIGPKYGEELAFEYSCADVTIMLSKAECFPMVCVESLLCGTRVVAFECGGPDKVYTEDMVAFIKWGDFEMMSIKLLDYLRNPYDKKKLSERASNLFSSKVMSNNYYNLYSKINSKTQ